MAAAKRWRQTHAEQFTGQRVTLLADDLYSHPPMCQQCLDLGMSFIFTALPDAHPALDE